MIVHVQVKDSKGDKIIFGEYLEISSSSADADAVKAALKAALHTHKIKTRR